MSGPAEAAPREPGGPEMAERSERTRAGTAGGDAAVEESGPWWGVFLFVIVVLFLSAAISVVRSLAATFS